MSLFLKLGGFNSPVVEEGLTESSIMHPNISQRMALVAQISEYRFVGANTPGANFSNLSQFWWSTNFWIDFKGNVRFHRVSCWQVRQHFAKPPATKIRLTSCVFHKGIYSNGTRSNRVHGVMLWCCNRRFLKSFWISSKYRSGES